MNIKKTINDNVNYRKKYEYYKSLGYSEKASSVLATVTYGDLGLQTLIKKLGASDDIIEKLYSWLETQEGGSALFDEDSYMPSSSSASPFFRLSSSLAVSGARHGISTAPGRFSSPLVFADCDEGDGFCSDEIVEDLSSDQYEPIEEKGSQDPLTTPTSTFRMTTNTASVGIVLNQIREGREVEMSQVRLEELMNYFRYQEEPPTDRKFKITTEQLKKGDDKELLYIHVGAKEETKEKQNIILLLDVSGSMQSQNEVTQLTIATVVSKLKIGDRFSLITYSDEDRTVFNGYMVTEEMDRERIMRQILSIGIDGCTYGSAGIETAYRIGREYYSENANNQVILITDGDLNFGITEKGGLIDLIEEKKKSNLFLSVIGTGLYNYKDDNLEALAKHGNGTYCVINELEDVRESIDRRYISLTNIVAKDVKAQVEFNPRFVRNYRLLGYENRALNHADFKDDTVISEPYGSGGYGVALYEITTGQADNSDLKYQKAELTDLDEICTVKVRYKEPLSDISEELSQVVKPEEGSSGNLKLAWLIYCLGEKLRESDRLDETDRKFYEEMMRDNAYKKLTSSNLEELELLISAV